MPARNFTYRPDLVTSGEKAQTIRKGHHFKVGDMMYCKEFMRTSRCRALNQGPVTEVIPIKWDGDGFDVELTQTVEWQRDLAWRDGFNSYVEMRNWFRAKYKEPFDGQIIRWNPERKPNET